MDNFFVPPLIFLAEKLKLSPSIAGITLLALGNGLHFTRIIYYTIHTLYIRLKAFNCVHNDVA